MAFTLSEMIVVLILTSIVVGMAYTVLGMVQKQMIVIQQNYLNQTNLKKLETSLWLDFGRYNSVYYASTENELKFSNEIGSLTYKFMGGYVIRETDTFATLIKSKELFFEAKKIDQGFVDALRIVTDNATQNQKLFIFKNNDATIFMK
jgi:type II secretory pathway pseudopilin PulG